MTPTKKTLHSPHSALLLVLALLLTATQHLSGQDSTGAEQSSPQKPSSELTIKTFVRRVIVDVVVTAPGGEPVRDLSAENFSIKEDGKPQQILSFDVHRSDSEADFVPPKLPALPTNSFINIPSSPERGPLNVLFLDLLDTKTEDQSFARAQLSNFVSNKPDGARFAIFVLSDGLYLVQGFTDDRQQLLDVLSSRRSNHLPRIFLYADNFLPYVSPLGGLTEIARFLSGLPGHKNIIWLAGSFPSFLLPGASPGISPMSFLGADPFTGGSRLIDDVQAATAALTRAQAAVYPVDARGVTGAWDPGQHTALNASYLMEDSIAEATGGKAFYSTNDLKTALADATETGANYYTLSYSPTNREYDGKLRHIEVETSKHGYHLAYRRSYYADDPEAPVPRFGRMESELLSQSGVIQPEDSLYVNMQHGVPTAHQLIFAAQVHTSGAPVKATSDQIASLAQQPAFFDAAKKNGVPKPLAKISLQPYTVDYRVLARQLRAEGAGGQPPTLELAVAAFDEDGAMLNAVVQKADTKPTEERDPNHQTFFVVQERIDVPTTAVWLRFGLRDNSSGRIGAMEIRLPLAPEPPRQAALPAPKPAVESSHQSPN